jgi:hypothetical protein
MVPDDADVCVCMDIDEWMPPGWRAALEAAWVPGCAEGGIRLSGRLTRPGIPPA